MRRFTLAGLLLMGLGLVVCGQDKPGQKAEPIEVPYRLTVPKHIMVRAKINNKGPYNFILDTGAPALFVATSVGEKLGLKADENGWTTFDRFEIEGGVVIEKAKGIVQTPFQLEGMNGMGLAGAELHGMIGYNIIARYRMEIDFTRDSMTWTPLDFDPKLPMRAGGKGGAPGGLEMMGGFMKTLGGIMGRKATPDVVIRKGGLGMELTEERDAKKEVVLAVRVGQVQTDGPAHKAGVKTGDKLLKVKGRTISGLDDVQRHTNKLSGGDSIELTIERGSETKKLTLEAKEGL